MIEIAENREYRFTYTNYKGEKGVRRVKVTKVWWGESPWHAKPGLFIEALDLDKGLMRSFAACDIENLEVIHPCY